MHFGVVKASTTTDSPVPTACFCAVATAASAPLAGEDADAVVAAAEVIRTGAAVAGDDPENDNAPMHDSTTANRSVGRKTGWRAECDENGECLREDAEAGPWCMPES